MRSPMFYRNGKERRERMLRKMANMRAAKERKRLANPVEPEPKMERWYPLEWAVRDKSTGETVWLDFKSVRDTARRLTLLQRHYLPGIRSCT